MIERVTCNNKGSDKDWNVSVRWRLQGLHEGIGIYGQPSGKPIEIFGINQLKIVNGQLLEEWFTYDGLEVLKQIYLDSDDENNNQ